MIGFDLYQSCGNKGSVECVSLCFGCSGEVGVEWVGAWTRGGVVLCLCML